MRVFHIIALSLDERWSEVGIKFRAPKHPQVRLTTGNITTIPGLLPCSTNMHRRGKRSRSYRWDFPATIIIDKSDTLIHHGRLGRPLQATLPTDHEVGT